MAAWNSLVESRPPKRIAPGADEAQRLLINFMPLVSRSIQAHGLILFYIRYWHPVFVVWRGHGRRVRVRYHPEDLSRIHASADGRNYVEARYADLRRPSISLWEQRAAVRVLRAGNEPRLSEELVFKAIGQQRQIVKRAEQQVRRVKAGKPHEMPWTPSEAKTAPDGAVDYSKHVAFRSGDLVMARDHLHLTTRKMLDLPQDERIRALQVYRWIDYPRATEALRRLRKLLETPERDRMPCMVLHGPSNIGKTCWRRCRSEPFFCSCADDPVSHMSDSLCRTPVGRLG